MRSAGVNDESSTLNAQKKLLEIPKIRYQENNQKINLIFLHMNCQHFAQCPQVRKRRIDLLLERKENENKTKS